MRLLDCSHLRRVGVRKKVKWFLINPPELRTIKFQNVPLTHSTTLCRKHAHTSKIHTHTCEEKHTHTHSENSTHTYLKCINSKQFQCNGKLPLWSLRKSCLSANFNSDVQESKQLFCVAETLINELSLLHRLSYYLLIRNIKIYSSSS